MLYLFSNISSCEVNSVFFWKRRKIIGRKGGGLNCLSLKIGKYGIFQKTFGRPGDHLKRKFLRDSGLKKNEYSFPPALFFCCR